MTYIAARAIHTAPPDRATAIGLQFFNTFKETPGAYTCLDSFMKQVRRTLYTFRNLFPGHNFRIVSVNFHGYKIPFKPLQIQGPSCFMSCCKSGAEK